MAGLKIFSSLTKKKELFSARDNKIGLYVCGITPYDVTHLGHAFTYVFFDVLVRYLRSLGYKVTYVQNLTDIDPDILRRAKEIHKSWRRLGQENANLFLADMKWLNSLRPDVYPRATDHIREMIELIKVLMKKKIAYKKGGNVYFEINKHKKYGKLSRLSRNKMIPWAIQFDYDLSDPNKKDPLDFILWQKQKLGEPSWSSPWGKGLPGWHIECSAMSQKYLGKTVDIYGGGGDLVYPHHENSIAQSETVNKKKCARYWMHVGMLRYQREKMSKSLGNMVFISDLKKKYNPNIVRLLLLSHHYRSSWEYFDRDIKKAKALDNLLEKAFKVSSGKDQEFLVRRYEKEFFSAMEDDINTKKAILVLEKLGKYMLNNKTMDLKEAKLFLKKAFNILGLKYGRS